MNHFRMLLLSVEVLASANAFRLQPDATHNDLDANGPRAVTVIFVRHGESVNNILSQSKDLRRYDAEGRQLAGLKLLKPEAQQSYDEDPEAHLQDAVVEGVSALAAEAAGKVLNSIDLESPGRDTFLSSQGLDDALAVREVLFGKDNDDKYDLFSGGAPVEAIYVSPMRRTVATVLAVFGKVLDKLPSVPVLAAPWAHEQLKSVSDLAHPASIVKDFANKYADHLGVAMPTGLDESLNQLPDKWSEEAEPVDADGWYYPREGDSLKPSESTGELCHRMQRLEKWLLSPEQPYNKVILVSHSAVVSALFDRYVQGRKPDNLGMFVGELISHGDDTLAYWRNVDALRNLPGFPQLTSGPQRIPAFLADSTLKEGETEPPLVGGKGGILSYFKTQKQPWETWCPCHLRLVSTSPVSAEACVRVEEKGLFHSSFSYSCSDAGMAVSIDSQYLVWQDRKDSKVQALALPGLRISFGGHAQPLPFPMSRACASSPEVKLFRGSEEVFLIKAKDGIGKPLLLQMLAGIQETSSVDDGVGRQTFLLGE